MYKNCKVQWVRMIHNGSRSSMFSLSRTKAFLLGTIFYLFIFFFIFFLSESSPNLNLIPPPFWVCYILKRVCSFIQHFSRLAIRGDGSPRTKPPFLNSVYFNQYHGYIERAQSKKMQR